ncbi:Pentatricopeptide repeat-containing protein [Pleurotus pulmonarius]
MLRISNLCPKELLLVGYQSITPRYASTAVVKQRQRSPSADSGTPRQIPRYIRRQALADAYATRIGVQKGKGSVEKAGSGAEEGRVPKLLEPHVLSARLKKLCDAGKIDDAVTVLKNVPLGAQNVPVWNTLIWECMKAKKYTLAYKLFTDMKRRGHSPNTRTYQTMFSGLSRIENWSSHPKQLANAHALYDYFQRHISSVKKHDPQSPQLSTIPLSYYIKILGETGHYQTIFDVYYALDGEGPMAPDQYIYTAMFTALAGKKMTVQGTATFDAKLLWSQMLKASQRSSTGFDVDPHLVTAAISALTHGPATDKSFALKLIREYFGLTKPGDPPNPIGMIQLTPPALAAALHLCNVSGDHQLALHFFRQVQERPERHGGVSVIDRLHVEEALRAYGSLASAGSASPYAYDALKLLEWMLKREHTAPRGEGIKVRPAASTFNLVLSACWHSSDWESAMSALQLMTGYHVADFSDKAVLAHGSPDVLPKVEKRSAGRNLIPDAETLSTIVRTAHSTRNRAHVRQALRIVDHFGADKLFGFNGNEMPSRKQVKRGSFYQSKLAESIVSSVEFVLGKNKIGKPGEERKEPWSMEEAQRWRALALQAAEVLGKLR